MRLEAICKDGALSSLLFTNNNDEEAVFSSLEEFNNEYDLNITDDFYACPNDYEGESFHVLSKIGE